MWDFDDVQLHYVIGVLLTKQLYYSLPNIYILNTGKPNSYIAYCFKKVSWQLAKEIIAATPFVCENFYKWGVFRRRFTLRVSQKSGRTPRLAACIRSDKLENANIDMLRSWVQYETLPDKAKIRMFKLGEK